MAGLAMLVLFLVAAAAVFVALRHDGNGPTGENESTGEIDRGRVPARR